MRLKIKFMSEEYKPKYEPPAEEIKKDEEEMMTEEQKEKSEKEECEDEVLDFVFEGDDSDNSIKKIANKFNLSKNEIEQIVKDVVIKNLSEWYTWDPNYLRKILARSQLPNSPELQGVVKKGIFLTLSTENREAHSTNVEETIEIILDIEKISPVQNLFSYREFQDAIKNLIIDGLKKGDFELVANIKRKYGKLLHIPKDVFSSQEVKEVAKDGIIARLEWTKIGPWENADNVSDDDEVKDSLKKLNISMKELFSSSEISEILEKRQEAINRATIWEEKDRKSWRPPM